MVAGVRLELTTFRVWTERSNQLSYLAINNKKWWTLTGSNRRPPACKAGALPAELRAHLNGREDRIRTCDPSVPNRMLYQAEPLPDNMLLSNYLNVSIITNAFFIMVRPKGLEPLTFWSVVKRSIQLIYGRMYKLCYYWSQIPLLATFIL